jgi:hypothetical protein
VALAPVGVEYTSFTGDLISVLRDGIIGGPAVLDIHSIFRVIRIKSLAAALPTPSMGSRGSVGDLGLIANPAARAHD